MFRALEPPEASQSDVETPKPFWIDLPSSFEANLPSTWPQLGSQNPPKSVKNRCQDAFHLGFHFGIDFWLVFVANFPPVDLKNHDFSFGKYIF